MKPRSKSAKPRTGAGKLKAKVSQESSGDSSDEDEDRIIAAATGRFTFDRITGKRKKSSDAATSDISIAFVAGSAVPAM